MSRNTDDIVTDPEIVLPVVPVQRALDAYRRFDLTEINDSRIGVSCEVPSILEPDATITIVRFGTVNKLTSNELGLCVDVKYDNGETEIVHLSRITYVDGKFISS